jgi:hypothetical protein
VRPAALALLAACGPTAPTPLGGAHGFEVANAVAIQCPDDVQGQFMKVFIEGTAPAAGCEMDLPRAIPVTCEDRRAYLQSLPQVCLGAPAAPGEGLPMLDVLLEREGEAWVDLDYNPLITCLDGEQASVPTWGEIRVTEPGPGRLRLEIPGLTDEDGGEVLLSGTVDVELCDAL